ncbi:HlyD family secretion protein [Variovorax sp. dw_308]|uniref:HlyD family secretion protein n=1 Tax=Variovorax sp. dw_308 TaxID=2721546 RepID=UPI001C441CE0|nr:HlyD family secretion protein [Variovorax sp. dw_308]
MPDAPSLPPAPAPPPVASITPPAPVARTWRTLARMALLVALVLLVFVIAQRWDAWTGGRLHQTTDDAFLQTDITPLGAKVSGYVLEAPAGDFAAVRRGQLLVALAPDDYRAQLAQQDANVAAALAALANNSALVDLQHANVRAAQAVIANAQAVLARNQREASRQRRLASDGAGTEQSRETADTSERQSTAQLEQSRAQSTAAERQLDVLAAQRKQADAALSAARANREIAVLNLGYTRIVAPDDGVVGQRQVRVGQYVSTGQQVAVLAALPRLWVLANFKETQIRRMRIGQPCEIAVDAFPGSRLAGHVIGFAPGTGSQFALLPPDNATGNFTKVVQRVGVKIALDDQGSLAELLRPGLSVVASVRTDE